MIATLRAAPALLARRLPAAATALLIALTPACTMRTQEAAPRPTPVHVHAAALGPAARAIATNGVVEAKDEMRLSFKVGGVVRRIAVQEGEQVKRGELLAQIELTEIDAQGEQARQLAAKAQRDLARGERLYVDQVISLEQLQDLRTQAGVTKAQLRAWSFNRGYAAITAPEDGVVLRKLVQERELVPAGQTVLTLGALERGFVVRAALADRDIVQFRLGDAAQIRMDAFPGRSFPGTISEIASAADAKTGLFPIEARFSAPGVALVNGLVAKLELHPSALQGATLTYVPIAAVVEGDRDRASVFVLEGDRARRRVVQVAFIAAESVALAAGVAPGEQVVTDGALYLEDNERVEVVRDAAQPVAGQALPGASAPAAG